MSGRGRREVASGAAGVGSLCEVRFAPSAADRAERRPSWKVPVGGGCPPWQPHVLRAVGPRCSQVLEKPPLPRGSCLLRGAGWQVPGVVWSSSAPPPPARPAPPRRTPTDGAGGPRSQAPEAPGGLSRTRVWRAALRRPPPSRPDKLRAFQIAPVPLGGRGAGSPLPGAAGLLPCWVPGPPRSAEPNLAHLNNV